MRFPPRTFRIACDHAGLAHLGGVCFVPESVQVLETCLRWTCNSVRKLAEDLNGMGHRVSYPVVAELLHDLGYSLQSNRKTKEGDSHPDRNAQFEYIDSKVRRYIALNQPVISVDTKEKELVGDFKNGGGSGGRKGIRKRFACMISRYRNSGALHRTEYTI